MLVLKPTVFENSMLISTTATELYANYSTTTTYADNARVVYNFKIYESLQASNINHQPDISPTWWLLIGADNRHAMFDQIVSTTTVKDSTLTITIATGVIDSFALVNLDTDTVKLTVRDGLGGTVVYEETGGISGSTVLDWYQYFFYDPLLKRTQLVFRGIPPYVNSYVTLEFIKTGTISIGAAVWGSLSSLGGTQYGASAGITDYSRKENDIFGNVTFIKRAYSKRMQAQVMVPNGNLNRVQQLLYSIRATPAVWIASDSPQFEEALVVYGWYRDFSTDISYPSHSICSLEIEGLI